MLSNSFCTKGLLANNINNLLVESWFKSAREKYSLALAPVTDRYEQQMQGLREQVSKVSEQMADEEARSTMVQILRDKATRLRQQYMDNVKQLRLKFGVYTDE